MKGVNGVTARSIELVVKEGFHTVEYIAYTYVVWNTRYHPALNISQTSSSSRTNQRYFGTKGIHITC